MNPYKYTDWGIGHLHPNSMFTIDIKELPHVIMGFSRARASHGWYNAFAYSSKNYSLVLLTLREEPVRLEIIPNLTGSLSLAYSDVEQYKNLWNKKTI